MWELLGSQTTNVEQDTPIILLKIKLLWNSLECGRRKSGGHSLRQLQISQRPNNNLRLTGCPSASRYGPRVLRASPLGDGRRDHRAGPPAKPRNRLAFGR